MRDPAPGPPPPGDPGGLGAELREAVAAAEAAGDEIRRLLTAGIREETKADGEPVTAADRAADRILKEALGARFPADALLTEETADDGRRLTQCRVWIVDPVDGTWDLLHGSAEFVVQVGLVREGRAVLGVLHQPLAGRTWCGVPGAGAWRRQGGRDFEGFRLPPAKDSDDRLLRLTVTRRHANPALGRILGRLPPHRLVRCGSVGLKAMLVAEGEADAYLAPTPDLAEWDACAPQAVAEAAGATVLDPEGGAVVYNRTPPTLPRGLLCCRPGWAETMLAAVSAAGRR